MPELHDLSPTPGSNRNRKRVGRGPGSGSGKTSGRGQDGQGSRSGGNVRPGFEGGQMPLQRRIPKRGFKNINRVEYQVVNVRDLSRVEGGEITPEILKAHGLVGTLRMPVKILGTGEIEGGFQVSAHAFSDTARQKIEGAGGTVTVLGKVAAEEAVAEPVADHVPETEETPAPEGDEASETESEKA